MQENPRLAQALAHGDRSSDRDGLGELVRTLAAVVVRLWCQGEHKAGQQAHLALGAFLKRDPAMGGSVIAPKDQQSE